MRGETFPPNLVRKDLIVYVTYDLLDYSAQKAFLKGINGCIEHSFVMNELIASGRNKKKTIHVTFFDLADACGSVEHNLINHIPFTFALQRAQHSAHQDTGKSINQACQTHPQPHLPETMPQRRPDTTRPPTPRPDPHHLFSEHPAPCRFSTSPRTHPRNQSPIS